MLLIDLPSELLQMILRYSSTPSFVQLIRTCHSFFDLAAQSRDVVKHHLNSVPGDKYILSDESEPTRELFLTLRRRAAASLQGVSISADRRDFYFQCASVHVHASSITSTNSTDIALVRKNSSSVQRYEAFQGELKLRGIFAPDLEQDVKYQPVHTTFDQMSNLYVLYYAESTAEANDSDGSLVKPLAESERFRLIRAGRSSLSCLYQSWNLGDIMLPRMRPIVPVSMTAQGGDKVSIAWDTNTYINHAKYISIALYTLYDGEKLLTFVASRLIVTR